MGFADWLRQRTGIPIPDDPVTDEEIVGFAHTLIDPAFLTLDQVEEDVREVLELDADDPRGTTLVQQVWAERLDQQSTWTDQGDYDRLSAAFAELEDRGIVGRMNFTCCQTCGHAEIEDERSPGSRGYTFFHSQDADQLAPGGSDLFLAYGSFGSDSEEAIGVEIAEVLGRHGLSVEWSGSVEQRIGVTRLDWRKRLPTG
ncbi:MAG TPA: hypothetical protein VFK52_04435 [Nocardioidaceae bacterium]|nr:hypothetical protein [Nocardioidaceae bacterium]